MAFSLRVLVGGILSVAGAAAVGLISLLMPLGSLVESVMQTAMSLHALDAFLMMDSLNHIHFDLLLVAGVGVLTFGTLLVLTPLALGFFVLDIHLEMKQVCDAQGNVVANQRRLFCKLRRPQQAQMVMIPVVDDAPTRFVNYGA